MLIVWPIRYNINIVGFAGSKSAKQIVNETAIIRDIFLKAIFFMVIYLSFE